MSRPTKNNADWFSHDTNLRNHRVVKVARNKWGADGYSVFCMLLEHLTDSDNFKIELSDSEVQVIAADFGIDEKLLKEIIEFYIWFDLLQKKWEFIYSQHLIDRLWPLLKKREKMREKYVQEKTPPKPTESPPKKDVMTEADFEKFWSAYPNKVEKKKAMTKFLKLKPSLLPTILTAIEKQKTSKKWKEWFIKNPLTWINGENWNDEIQIISSTNEPQGKWHSNTGKISTEWSADDTVAV